MLAMACLFQGLSSNPPNLAHLFRKCVNHIVGNKQTNKAKEERAPAHWKFKSLFPTIADGFLLGATFAQAQRELCQWAQTQTLVNWRSQRLHSIWAKNLTI